MISRKTSFSFFSFWFYFEHGWGHAGSGSNMPVITLLQEPKQIGWWLLIDPSNLLSTNFSNKLLAVELTAKHKYLGALFGLRVNNSFCVLKCWHTLKFYLIK